MTVLRSYVGGRWFAPDSGTPVYDAVTGYTIAEVSSDGIDFGAVLAYGRSVGGPALRQLTFHQRAALAKSVGLMLREHRDELYQLSYRTGATLADSKFDIDGGIGVLLGYASKAKRELPDSEVVIAGSDTLSDGALVRAAKNINPYTGAASRESRLPARD